MYYNLYSSDTLVYSYIIIDENGNAGAESAAHVYINIENNYFDFWIIIILGHVFRQAGFNFWPGPSQIDNLPVFEFPKGSKKNTIFNSTLWVGGIDELGELKTGSRTISPGRYGLLAGSFKFRWN